MSIDSIDVTDPNTLTLAEACRILPRGRNNARPHLSTLIRWITLGAVARDGRRVRLAACRCGSKWLTSRAALMAFTKELTGQIEDAAGVQSPTRKNREDQATARELESRGL